MIIITDLLTLTDFFEEIANGTPGIDYFLPLSNAEKAVDEIQAYYNHDYRGTTAFLQVAESKHVDNGSGLDSLTFLCSLTVATKPEDTGARAGMVARDLTQKLLLKFLGQIKTAVDQSIDALEDADEPYEFSVAPAERMFPIGKLANVILEGQYIDIDVTIPANHLLFPA